MFDCVFQYPHAAGHTGIGGVMNDVAGSPGDPMFFMHHGFIDRNWWYWQNEDPEDRLCQVNGNTTLSEPSTRWATLHYNLTSYHILPDTAIRNVMDTEGGFLGYNYDYLLVGI